ncbi:MAG TPA: carbohydrate binding domain-containing protein, partial [bacterium]|nr:carbohydrate binding domain-containing protein [bacterium]
MKKILSLLLTAMLLQASAVFAAVVEDWSNIASSNTGAYQDSNGSKIDFAQDAGPEGGKALKLTSNLVSGGYCGVWHTISADLSKNGSLKFKAKSTVPGDVQLAIVDAFGVQYVTKASISSKDWAVVEVPLSSFAKDPYYTPPQAVLGHPMDLSKVSNLNFSPQVQGASVVEIGTVESSGTASASTSSAASTSSSTTSTSSSTASSGAAVQVLDAATVDSKAAGTFQDSQGSSFTFTTKDNPSKKGQKYLSITYDLKQGGYCGMWCRAGGADWNGANLASAKTLSLTIYSKDPLVLGIALKDKNNNQYVAETPMSKGGKWET